MKGRKVIGYCGFQLVRSANAVNEFGRPATPQTCRGRRAVANECIEAADEVRPDGVEMLRLPAE
jgi:hypothetical protein